MSTENIAHWFYFVCNLNAESTCGFAIRMLENMLITLVLTVARYFAEIASASSGDFRKNTDTTVKNNTALELQLTALLSIGWGSSFRRSFRGP